MRRDERQRTMGSVRYAVVALLALVSGCGRDGSSEPAPHVLTAAYVITGVSHRGVPKSLLPGSHTMLRFEYGNVSLVTDCGAMTRAYTLVAGRLSGGGFSWPDSRCDQRHQDQDAWLSTLLSRPAQVDLAAHRIVATGGTVISFAEAVPRQSPLRHEYWTLTEVREGALETRPPTGNVPGITFWPDEGRANAWDGCERLGWDMWADSAAVTWRPEDLSYTPLAENCPAGPLLRLRKAFRETLRGATRFSVSGDVLEIQRAGRVLVLHRAKKPDQDLE